MQQRNYRIATDLGVFGVTFNDVGLSQVRFPGKKYDTPDGPKLADQEGATGRKLVKALQAFAAGRKFKFNVPLDLSTGTVFQRDVWKMLLRIPLGTVWTYGEMAEKLGRPGAARAVGSACGANPVPVVVPCHRVVATTGLGGFGGGLALKQELLELEGCECAV